MFYRIFLLIFLLPAFAFSYTLVRNDGKSFNGELIQQSPQATIIKDAAGVTMRFQANQIDWSETTIRLRNEEQTRPSTSLSVPQQNYEKTQIIKPANEWTGEPFSFDFKDIDIKDLFRFIADISGLNVILDPSVKGTVTLKLTEVPWDQALDLITRNQGLGYTIEGNVIRIAPYSKFEQELSAQRRIEQERFLSAPLVTKIIQLSYAKAAEMDLMVKKFLTQKGSTIVDRRTNTLIITDVESNNALWGFTAVAN